MKAILLKKDIHTNDIKELIHKGINDMDITTIQKQNIEELSYTLSESFVKSVQYHLENGDNPDASYAFQIAIFFNQFIEDFRNLFIPEYSKDILTAFGISAIWMGILNGLDAESGIMPNHPFKREIANSLKAINEILDECKK